MSNVEHNCEVVCFLWKISVNVIAADSLDSAVLLSLSDDIDHKPGKPGILRILNMENSTGNSVHNWRKIATSSFKYLRGGDDLFAGVYMEMNVVVQSRFCDDNL